MKVMNKISKNDMEYFNKDTGIPFKYDFIEVDERQEGTKIFVHGVTIIYKGKKDLKFLKVPFAKPIYPAIYMVHKSIVVSLRKTFSIKNTLKLTDVEELYKENIDG